MVQELLLLMPRDAGQAATVIALGGCVLGAVFWLLGARYSRGVIALLAVAVGGVLGMTLPRYYGWTVNTQATAVGGAVVLGLSGWLVHRVWVGVGLGLVLATWAALGTWIIYNDPAVAWAWPTVSVDTTLVTFGTDTWAQVPENIRKLLPYACGAAMLTGVCATLLWPKLGAVMLYSTAGVSLIVLMGLAAMEFARPQWLAHVPPITWVQLTLIGALVGFGAVVQWNVVPEPTARLPKNESAPTDPAINEIMRKH